MKKKIKFDVSYYLRRWIRVCFILLGVLLTNVCSSTLHFYGWIECLCIIILGALLNILLGHLFSLSLSWSFYCLLPLHFECIFFWLPSIFVLINIYMNGAPQPMKE